MAKIYILFIKKVWQKYIYFLKKSTSVTDMAKTTFLKKVGPKYTFLKNTSVTDMAKVYIS